MVASISHQARHHATSASVRHRIRTISLKPVQMRLRWSVPHILPHGPTGVALISIGSVSTMQTIHSGTLVSPEVAIAIAGLAMANAWSGNQLLPSHLSDINTKRVMFSLVSQVQYCLSYELVRFACFDTGTWLQPVDAACGIFLSLLLARLYRGARALQSPVKDLVAVGVVAALTFACYPIQMGFFPETWFPLVEEIFVDQHAAMASFVYAPTLTLISFVMFAATLYERKKIDDYALSVITICVPVVLILTVTFQEILFADTATQQLVLGVPMSDPVIWVRAAMSWL